MDNNPVLSMSPGDLKRDGLSITDYLSRFSEAERAVYLDYYEDEM